MIVAVILARGGSKRLPGKNKRLLGGRPLVAWSIVEALKSPHIENIIVSTDDREIQSIAGDYGVGFIDRPTMLARDETSSYDALLHALVPYEDDEWAVLLQPTSPLRLAEDIDAAVVASQGAQPPAVASVAVGADTPNGAVYVGRLDWLRAGGNWDGPDVTHTEMPAERSIDIDTLDDFRLAEIAVADGVLT